MTKVMINDLPKQERPREQLINYGKNNVSNEDLIAIILRTGTKAKSVKELANKILSTMTDITEMQDLTLPKLQKIKGIGLAKATTILAAIELGKRVYQDKPKENIKIKTAEDVFKFFYNNLKNKKQEYFYVLFLDQKKKVIGSKLLFKGSLNISIVHPREIFKEALKYSAASFICVHNHPSGDETPSNQDIAITKRIKTVSLAMGIKFDDHIIIGKNYFSFYENNYI